MTKIIELFLDDLKGNPWLKPEDFFQLKNLVSFLASYLTTFRVTRRLVKKFAKFKTNSPKSRQVKKGQKIYNKAQFESQKHLHFETFKYLQQTMLWNWLFRWKLIKFA